ncbi:calcium-binding protein P-like [Mustela putorius furo]|uniref:Calcium-binding protein P-like n=1 Tax=Mustela putorius furo TaxID=9669 RepID=A0A8U0RKH4_MUSPF|nr:calcium-binding protein P-like [Mustela putorius furo]
MKVYLVPASGGPGAPSQAPPGFLIPPLPRPPAAGRAGGGGGWGRAESLRLLRPAAFRPGDLPDLGTFRAVPSVSGFGDRGAHQSQTPCAEGRPFRSPGDLVPRQRAVTQFLPAAAAGVARQGQLRPQEERRGGKVAARSFTSEPRRPPGPRSARAEKESSLHPTWGLNSPLGNEVPHSSQEPAIRPPIYLFKGQSLSLNGLHPLGDQQRSSGGPGGWRSFPPASLSPAQATPVPHASKRFPLPQLRVSPGTKVEMPSPGGQSLGSSSFYPPFLARLDRGLSAFLGRPFQSFLKRVPDRAATPSAHGRRRRDPLIPFGRLLRLAAGGVQLGVRERAWRAAPRTIMRRW